MPRRPQAQIAGREAAAVEVSPHTSHLCRPGDCRVGGDALPRSTTSPTRRRPVVLPTLKSPRLDPDTTATDSVAAAASRCLASTDSRAVMWSSGSHAVA